MWGSVTTRTLRTRRSAKSIPISRVVPAPKPNTRARHLERAISCHLQIRYSIGEWRYRSRQTPVCHAQSLSPIILFAPALIGQTYLGIADCDDVAIGPSGDLYLSCHSPSDRLPIEVNAFERSNGGMEAYVLRYNPKTEKLVYATRIAGADYDNAIRIKVDQHGFAYSTGFTKSRDFRTTTDAIQQAIRRRRQRCFLVEARARWQSCLLDIHRRQRHRSRQWIRDRSQGKCLRGRYDMVVRLPRSIEAKRERSRRCVRNVPAGQMEKPSVPSSSAEARKRS